MQPIERLGAFYLGRPVDPASGAVGDEPLMYDARDLTTHAVCVGMTGSGKTGLCIGLLEEAALDGVPALILDPKGDITNLLLTFPELRPQDFEPWIDPGEARRKNATVPAYAAKTAALWRKGLAEWGQGPERIAKLKDAAEFRLYTPGSDAGRKVSILASLKAPAGGWGDRDEEHREQIAGTVSALLSLAGIQADPLRDREHILLSTVVEHEWRAGRDLDLARLISLLPQPPVRKIGVFDVDTFFPEKDRFQLAMAFNAILAAPSFGSWLEGDPLDIAALLYSPAGKPRHCIFSLAHLSDPERMFFTTLLLEQAVAWMRRQPGTGSLRALIYMDEVFGYLPPTANPPSKRPLLTLFKQARAFGLGVVLTTQNPVDLDYKALSNAGTWFLGKLQTEQDKARVLDGLSAADGSIDRKLADELLSGLGSRVFLKHNVHDDGPELFHTRWAMSYLRGPLTREQIRRLTPADAGAPAPAASPAGTDPVAAAPAAPAPAGPPALPPGVPQAWLPACRSRAAAVGELEAQEGGRIEPTAVRMVYAPAVGAFGRVRFVDKRRGVDEERSVARLLAAEEVGAVIRWDETRPLALAADGLESEPEPEAGHLPVPERLTKATAYRSLAKDFKEHLYREHELTLWTCPELKLFGAPGESEAEFRARAKAAAREARDAEIDKLRAKVEKQLDRLETRLMREERELEEDRAKYDSRKKEELISAGETLIGLLGLFGKRRSATGLSKAATKRRMTSTARMSIAESEQEIAKLQEEIAELRTELERDAEEISARWDAVADGLETMAVTPRRTDVRADLVSLVWVPSWEISWESPGGGVRTGRVACWED